MRNNNLSIKLCDPENIFKRSNFDQHNHPVAKIKFITMVRTAILDAVRIKEKLHIFDRAI